MTTFSVTGFLESYGNSTFDNQDTLYTNVAFRLDDGSLKVLENVSVSQKFSPVFRLGDRVTVNFFTVNKKVVPYFFTNGVDTIDLTDFYAREKTKALWFIGPFLSLWFIIPLIVSMTAKKPESGVALLVGLFTFGLIVFIRMFRIFRASLKMPTLEDMKKTNAAHADDIASEKEVVAA